MLAEIITIGDEILIGQIVDTNSAWMGEMLNTSGISVKQITSVSDNSAHIKEAVSSALRTRDIVLITGGLGPTRDDITKHTLCELFGISLTLDTKALENVEEIFSRRNLPLLETNKQQAMLPDGCIPLYNSCGTAPGMWFNREGKVVVSMPGVPFEMKAMMELDVIPRLRNSFTLPVIYHHTLQTAGMGESFVARKIEAVEDALPSHISLAYLPHLGGVRLRLSARGTDETTLKKEVKEYAAQIMEILGKVVYAEGEVSLPEHVCTLLKENNVSLSLAESCTGGYVTSLLTRVPGVSEFFPGSIVTYSYASKEKELGVNPETLSIHGAVSQECVNEMLIGCVKKFGTNAAIAISGIAGPSGGTPDKPVGTVFIGAYLNGKKSIQRFQFETNRIRNIERSAQAALNMLRLLFLEK